MAAVVGERREVFYQVERTFAAAAASVVSQRSLPESSQAPSSVCLVLLLLSCYLHLLLLLLLSCYLLLL